LFLLGLAAVSLAVLGRAQWADAGWYYHFSPAYRLERGRQALLQGDRNRAEQVAQCLATSGHGDPAALLRGEILFRQGRALAETGQAPAAVGRLAAAIEEFNKIEDQGSIRLEAAALSGQCFLYLKRPREAERLLRFVLQEQPDHVDAHRALAAVYFDQGAMTPAVQHLQRVAALDDADGRPHRLMGLIFKDREDYATAVDCYRQALARELRGQPPAKIRLELAECLSKLNRYHEATDLLAASDFSDEDAPAVAVLRATCLIRQGQAAAATAILDRALAAFPDDAVLLRERAIRHVEAKEAEAALPLLRRALDMDRHDYSSHYQLGLVYRMLGRGQEAAEQLRLAEQIKTDLLEHERLTREAASRPWDASVRLRLAALSDRLGRPADAASWREAAVACPVATRDERP
jgi:tetratricopeptide (TPR) repeat protein